MPLRHVTPQINISLISDRHPSIISGYNNSSNLWVQDTSHFFCLRHIAQKFLRGNSNCKHLKKPLMLAGYTYTEKMHWRHLGDIRANKPSAGKRWGHMTTNLSEYVNSMLKNIRHLPVSSLVEETYFKTAQLFANRGRQTQAMINSGSQYSEIVFDAMNSGQQESNIHIAKHLPCSHVMAVCKSVNVDPMTYVLMIFTLQHILHIYDNSFDLLPHESMWQEYEGDQWGPDPRRKRTVKGHPVSTRIPTEMDEDENERASRKKCGLCRQHGDSRNNCPNISSS
ncbi:hypothetical protein HKD37_03G006581 [Glycine soja]